MKRPKYKIILFDLDGTLADPRGGIIKSIQFALKKTEDKRKQPADSFEFYWTSIT